MINFSYNIKKEETIWRSNTQPIGFYLMSCFTEELTPATTAININSIMYKINSGHRIEAVEQT
jgi:hypothetical protein